METLDLAVGARGAWRGEAMRDAVLPADLVEEHLGGGEAIAVGEDLAVVGEHFVWHAVALEGLDEMGAHRSGQGPDQDTGADAEAGVVVDAGEDLALGAVL